MPAKSTLSRQRLAEGGRLDGPGCDPAALARLASDAGLALFDVDCARAKTKSALLRAIANGVDFPEHFGGNLDALYDCLLDTLFEQPVGAVLALRRVHADDPGLSAHVDAVLQVLDDAAAFAREDGKAFAYVFDRVDGVAEPRALEGEG